MAKLTALLRTTLRRAALAIAATATGAPVAAASFTDPSEVVTLDVLPGWTSNDGVRMAALRLRLKPGWKTYWRTPGEAGIPPYIDWSGSANLHAVRLHWPRPKPFDQFGMTSLGYKDELVLPVELLPADAGQDLAVSGQMTLGVCKEICLPVTLDFSAMLPRGETGGSKAIQQALDERPGRAASPAVCDLRPINDGLRITATLDVSEMGGQEIVVFEPGRPDLWVSEANVTRQAGTVTASADIVPPQAQPFALSRSAMRITLIGTKGAVEFDGCSGG